MCIGENHGTVLEFDIFFSTVKKKWSPLLLKLWIQYFFVTFFISCFLYMYTWYQYQQIYNIWHKERNPLQKMGCNNGKKKIKKFGFNIVYCEIRAIIARRHLHCSGLGIYTISFMSIPVSCERSAYLHVDLTMYSLGHSNT